MLAEGAGQNQNDIISFSVPENVIERLEVVDVKVAGMECDASAKQAVDVLVDRNIAWQLGERVSVAGGLDLHFSNQADQLVGVAEPDVLALAGNNKTGGVNNENNNSCQDCSAE